jgi:DNA-directed RNA polymerase subunit RPC12/RpoP
MTMNDETGEGYVCDVCGKPFAAEEWEERHWGDEGEEYHEACCPICAEEDEEDEEDDA